MKIIAFTMMLVLFSAVAFAEEGPPEDLDKLQRESVKRFHVRKEGKSLELREGLSKPYPGKPEEAAEMFLKDYHKMFKYSKDIEELKLVGSSKDPAGSNIRYQKYYKGVPMFSCGAYAIVDHDNRIYGAGACLIELNDFNVDPVIKPDELQGVMEQMHPEYGTITAFKPELIIYFVEGKPVLAYHFFTTMGETHDKIAADLIVDASIGKILKSQRIMIGDFHE